MNRDGVKINWKFDRKTARGKFGYKGNSFKRSETYSNRSGCSRQIICHMGSN
jgi:hypothetical protein